MGLVVKAWHLTLGKQVAIKMLRDDVALAEETVARFAREAHAAAQLMGEHIARIIDVDKFEDGKPYMVMEYLEGQDIGQMLVETSRLQPSLAIDLIIQACEALAEAHSLGIVHRDIKPTNLFLTSHPDGSLLLKILDFGISKAPTGPELYLTQTWSLLGTPAYMSPEQMRSAHDVDARTDIWSLGAVLYEALEGHVPFEADSFSEMCVMVTVDPPAPMSHTPRELVPIIMRCLAKAPEDRYANVAELARDLARVAREPESAHLLVDRMFRMLGRGAIRRTPPAGIPHAVAPPSEAFPSVETTLPHRPDATPTNGVAIRLASAAPASSPPGPPDPISSPSLPVPRGPTSSAIGVPLGSITGPLSAPPVRPSSSLIPTAPRSMTPLSVPAQRPSSNSIALATNALGPDGEPYPGVPTYQTRVPLPLPLHDDALFPRPGLQLPRGAPTGSSLSPEARRSWVVVAVTGVLALAAVVAVVAATRSSPIPSPHHRQSRPPTKPAPASAPIEAPAATTQPGLQHEPPPPPFPTVPAPTSPTATTPAAAPAALAAPTPAAPPRIAPAAAPGARSVVLKIAPPSRRPATAPRTARPPAAAPTATASLATSPPPVQPPTAAASDAIPAAPPAPATADSSASDQPAP